jgi:DNA-binding CsgD family transcriptional regulator
MIQGLQIDLRNPNRCDKSRSPAYRGEVTEPEEATGYPRPRRQATPLEAKALAHPLRARILRLCARQELTNKQLADRLGIRPGTVFYHVRLLLESGLLQPGEVRTGASGALEKPYRSTGTSWWLDNPLGGEAPEVQMSPIEAFRQELAEAGPESVAFSTRITLHLSAAEAEELDRRLLAVLDPYVETDHERLDRPALGGIVVFHRLAD